MSRVPRQELVEELLRMYDEHPCCSDPVLYAALTKEIIETTSKDPETWDD